MITIYSKGSAYLLGTINGLNTNSGAFDTMVDQWRRGLYQDGVEELLVAVDSDNHIVNIKDIHNNTKSHKPKYKRSSDKRRSEVLTLHASGHSLRAIANRLDISKSTVARLVAPKVGKVEASKGTYSSVSNSTGTPTLPMVSNDDLTALWDTTS